MQTGILAFSVVVGGVAAGFALFSGISWNAALLVYALTGTLFILLLIAMVALREGRQAEQDGARRRSPNPA